MPLEDRKSWKNPRGPTWFRKIIDDIYKEITSVQPLSGQQTDVGQTENGRQIDWVGGAGGGAGGEDNDHYEFEAIDWSDDEGAKVLIYDGFVYGPNDDGDYPSGMTGFDDFVAGPFTSDVEVWLEIWVDFASWNVISMNINWGSETPEDNDSTIFVTICFVGIEYTSGSPSISKVKDISNAICGDYVINPGLDVTGDLPEGGDFEQDHINQINFLGAVATHHDPGDVNPSAVDVDIGMYISDDDGHSGDLVWGIEFVGYNATVVSIEPDGTTLGSFATVKILPDPPTSGFHVLRSDGGDVDWAATIECPCGGDGGGGGGGGGNTPPKTSPAIQGGGPGGGGGPSTPGGPSSPFSPGGGSFGGAGAGSSW